MAEPMTPLVSEMPTPIMATQALMVGVDINYFGGTNPVFTHIFRNLNRKHMALL